LYPTENPTGRRWVRPTRVPGAPTKQRRGDRLEPSNGGNQKAPGLVIGGEDPGTLPGADQREGKKKSSPRKPVGGGLGGIRSRDQTGKPTKGGGGEDNPEGFKQCGHAGLWCLGYCKQRRPGPEEGGKTSQSLKCHTFFRGLGEKMSQERK